MKLYQILLLTAILTISTVFTSHQVDGIILCGVTISGGGGTTTTNNSPCINVTSITSNSSGIIASTGNADPFRTYNMYAPISNQPVTSTWRSQSINESDWLVTSNYADTLMTITKPKINKTMLDLYDGTTQTTYDGVRTTVNIFNNHVISLLFNATSSPSTPTIIPDASGQTITSLNITWNSIPRNVSEYDVFLSTTNNNVVNAWYHINVGSPTLTKILGNGPSSMNVTCNARASGYFIGTGHLIYYPCASGLTEQLNHIDAVSGLTAHDFSASCPRSGVVNFKTAFITETQTSLVCGTDTSTTRATIAGNVTVGSPSTLSTLSSEKLFGTAVTIRYNSNGTAITDPSVSTTTACQLRYIPDNSTVNIDDIACDNSIPADVSRFWNGMEIHKVGNYYTNSTLPFFNLINPSIYKVALTLPPQELHIPTQPYSDFILSDGTHNYLVLMTLTKIYYTDADAINTQLHEGAVQSYFTTRTDTTTLFPIPKTANLMQTFKIYGFNINQTFSSFGMFSLSSGFTAKASTSESVIRPIDPTVTNDGTNIPIIYSQDGSFPLLLTITNAPLSAGIKILNPTIFINTIESGYSVGKLDATRTAEFDLPAKICVDVYMTDLSINPHIWTFQGNVCTTGLNQKTLAYTDTLPLNFWTLPYGVSDTYTPQNNVLQTVFHSKIVPTNYTVIVFNSTGADAIVQSFVTNGTIDTQNFNVSSVSKPATLSVRVNGQQVYSSFLGSPISFASVGAFFSTYFSYHGFNLLSLLPIIFAGMFTRNSVGIGAVAVVLLIASLNFFSLVVVPQTIVVIMMFVSLIGLIAYRVLLY
jgi:hypothetical protein